MAAHAKLSPSSADRWFNCPGSAKLNEGKESPDNEFSREGSFAHAVAAECLEKGGDATARIGTTDGEFTLDAEMAAHVNLYLQTIRESIDMFGLVGKLWIESSVMLTGDVWGTADAMFLDEQGVLHVWDLKFGKGHFVTAEGNRQLSIYGASAAFGRYATAKVTHVMLHIVQPRRLDSDGNAHRSALLTFEEIAQFRQDAIRAELATKANNAPLNPGEYCRFCPSRAECPALRGAAVAAAQDVFADVNTLDITSPPELTELSVERIAKMLRAADVVEAWIAAVREHANQRARHVTIPGFKLVNKLSNRRWKSPSDATKLLTEAGVNPYVDPEVVSPAEAERRLGKSRKSLVNPLTERVPTASILVPESDPRPALSPGAVFLTEE